jgi:hypothetical protein
MSWSAWARSSGERRRRPTGASGGGRIGDTLEGELEPGQLGGLEETLLDKILYIYSTDYCCDIVVSFNVIKYVTV